MGLSGHIVRREDKPKAKCRIWELVVNLPKKGKRYPTKTRAFHGTYREAQSALRSFISEIEQGTRPLDASMTFSEYSMRWHERRKDSGAYASRTIDREQSRIKNASLHLGDIKIKDISREDVESCYSSLMKGKSLSGAPLSAGTIHAIHCTLSAIFSNAVRDSLIDSAPTSHVKLPDIQKTPRNVPDAESVDRMVSFMDTTDDRCICVMLCALCGLRRSEAVAVEIEDFDGESITVSRSLDDDGNVKPTKTAESRRVPVPEPLRTALKEWEGTGRISGMRPHSLWQWWMRHREEYGMECGLHDLRHAYATRLAMAGVHPRVMMALGGWSSIDVCMQIYSHATDSALDDAVSRAFE